MKKTAKFGRNYRMSGTRHVTTKTSLRGPKLPLTARPCMSYPPLYGRCGRKTDDSASRRSLNLAERYFPNVAIDDWNSLPYFTFHQGIKRNKVQTFQCEFQLMLSGHFVRNSCTSLMSSISANCYVVNYSSGLCVL